MNSEAHKEYREKIEKANDEFKTDVMEALRVRDIKTYEAKKEYEASKAETPAGNVDG